MKRTYTVVLEVDDKLDNGSTPTEDMDHLSVIATWIEAVLMAPGIKVDVTVYAGNLIPGEKQ